MKPLRILMLATYFPKPGNPLIGTWALDQAQALRRTGAEVEVVSLTPWVPTWPGQGPTARAYARCPTKADWNGLTVHYPRWLLYPVTAFERRYRVHPELWLGIAWALGRARVTALAEAWRPDVIFAHHTCVNGWVARRLAAQLGVPFFCQDHALWEIADCERLPRLRRLFSQVADSAAAMLAVSKRMAADLHRLFPQARIAVLPNGANLPRLAALPLPAGQRPPVIFSAGMFVTYKAFDVLLQAWALVHPRFPEARLRIAGDGPEGGRLRALCTALNLDGTVEFLGYLPQDKVQAEMAAARAFVLASWNETFGVVFLEAAATGAPCIWVNNAGVADVFVDGVHGVAVAPYRTEAVADAILHLLAHPDEAEAMGDAARRLVQERLSWDAIATQALRLFARGATG